MLKPFFFLPFPPAFAPQGKETLHVAIIGQSLFAVEVYKAVKSNGHRIVGVFTIPDQGSKEDPLGNTFS